MASIPNRLHVVGGHCDPVDECARAVVAHFADTLPDLRRAVIVMPQQLHQARLRRCLLTHAQEHGCTALLPPTIATLNILFRERMLVPSETLSQYECELLIANALAEHPQLLPHVSHWEFARQFLRLFDELAATYPKTLPTSLNASVTAEIVQRLYAVWYAIQEKTPDAGALYRNSLQENTLTGNDQHVFICGLHELSPHESAWARRLYEAERLTLIARARAHGRYVSPALETAGSITGKPLAPTTTDTAFGCFLDAAFSDDDIVSARAHAIKNRFADSPASERISVFKPETLEQHAFGIYLQIRDWLEARLLPIAVVSQDRKLSRRLRAVLEANGIPLHDHAGWTLSTTASATAMATLIPPGERDFDAAAILTLTRSPYCYHGIEVERTQAAGSYLEKRLAELEAFRDFDETVAELTEPDTERRKTDRAAEEQAAGSYLEKQLAGLKAFRDFDETATPLTEPDTEHRKTDRAAEDAKMIVRRIAAAVAGLRQLMRSRRPALSQLFDALHKAMQELGMIAALRRDNAGEIIVEELEAMALAAGRQKTHGNWNQWRGWVVHTLENKNFVPKEHRYLLEFYSLSQASLARPAGLVVAALDADHAMPGDPLSLIDEELRQTLGLPTRNRRLATQFDLFRTALENAGRTLLTCRKTDAGRMLAPAPWLDGLQHFHALAYGCDLEEKELERRAEAAIRDSTGATMPPPAKPQMPAPGMSAPIGQLSVSTAQTAVLCPYRFFAKQILKLAPAPEVEPYDSPRTYGLHLHRCLAALHRGMDRPWAEEHRSHALKLARDIVEAEFSPYVERHFSSVERKQQILASIDWYIDWLIENTDAEAVFEVETPREKKFPDELHLRGRPDCVVHENDGIHILDYKTRYRGSRNAMLDGEDIQLTAYALFYDKVKAVSYLDMKGRREVALEGEELIEVRKRLLERLQTFEEDAAGSPLPAWGNDESCRYCDYGGVCRRKAWN